MPTISITDGDNNRSFDAQVGDQITVRLEESATTGYRWELERLDHAIVTPKQTDFTPLSTAVGGGGELILEFEALQPGVTELALKLWRSWEGESSVINRFSVKITVH
jgi:inhibitor of cysteine peptidase